MIDQASITVIVGAVLGCWATGYGVGKLVAWTKKIQSVA